MPVIITRYCLVVVFVFFSLLTMPCHRTYGQTYTMADTAQIKKWMKEVNDSFATNPQYALNISVKAIEVAEKIGYHNGIANTYLRTGELYSETGNREKADDYLQRALKSSKEYHLKKTEVKVLDKMGATSEQNGDYANALSCFTESLNICKAINDSAGMAQSYKLIGHCFSSQDNFNEAFKNLNNAINIYTSLNRQHDIAGLCTNLSALFFNHKEYPKALNYLYQAINIYNKLNDTGALSNPYNQLATYFQITHQYDSSLYYYTKSLKIAINTGNKIREADALYGIGSLNYDVKKYAEAENYYKEAFSIAKQVVYKDFLFRIPHDLALTYASMQHYKNAYEYMDTSYEMRDSILTDVNQKAIAEMQVKFDVKELDDKNKLLEKENDLKQSRLQQKSILMYSGFGVALLFLVIGWQLMRQNRLKTNQQKLELEQKQLLAQINPHFIFNCLNSIQQFVVQNDTMNANRYLADFALLMRQTLDNSKDGIISLRREIEYLENYLSFEDMRFEDKFTYTIDCAPDINKDTTEIPSMIIQPFVENAIRHGLCNLETRKGLLHISFYKQEGFLYCEVDDNGIGMEEAKKLKEQTFIKYQSHGMELTRQRLALVSKMHSEDYKITIVNKKDAAGEPAGTTIIIKFPLNA